MFLKLLAALCLLIQIPLHAEEAAAAPAAETVAPAVAAPSAAAWADKVKLSGFMKAWLSAGDNAAKDYRAGTAMVKNLRLKVEGKPNDSVTVVVVPEFAGQTTYAVTLLDANIAVKRGPAEFVVGQFLVPFGQDTLTNPAKLWSVDASMVQASVKPGNARDQGAMAVVKGGPATLKLAAVQGLGINVATATGLVTDRNDYAGQLEVKLPSGLVVGGAFYSGWAGLSEPLTYSEAHLRCDSMKPLPAVFWKAEFINRPDTGRWGIAGNLGVKTGDYKSLLVYERVEDVAHALGKTRLGGGVTRAMGDGVSLSLMSFGEAAGAEVKPTQGRTILQLLAEF